MQSTLRRAVPLRLHQIWDAIGRGQDMDFEKLIKVITKRHKIQRDEVSHELNHAIRDGLVRTELVETEDGEETQVYHLIHESLDKGSHDWYCFICHMGGPVILCSDCPRVFHLDCLPEDKKPNKDSFICPPCQMIAAKPSLEKVGLGLPELNQLIWYVCERFKSWRSDWMEHYDGVKWAVASKRGENEGWRLNVLVYSPMDLCTMQEKASASKYESLEEFRVDCETLFHAILVYFGAESRRGRQYGVPFIHEIMHDIQEIKLCHQCVRRSNEKDSEWWFALPCTPPHAVVWAKQAGYPFWPAKVMKRDGENYDVRYFGGNYERAIIDAANIRPIETSLDELKVRLTPEWKEAYEELDTFLEIAKDPELVNNLPARKTRVAPGIKGGKRTTPLEEMVAKKRRKSDPTVAKPRPKKAKETPPKTECTPATRSSTRQTASCGASNSTECHYDHAFVDSLMGLEEDNLGGDVSFSDVEFSEETPKVLEDVVSSSCNCNEEKSTRNAYIQVTPVDTNVERLIDYIEELKTQIESNKRKQWCYNCGGEATYHCCWNTAYCGFECQHQHWKSEHKRLCRRMSTKLNVESLQMKQDVELVEIRQQMEEALNAERDKVTRMEGELEAASEEQKRLTESLAKETQAVDAMHRILALVRN